MEMKLNKGDVWLCSQSVHGLSKELGTIIILDIHKNHIKCKQVWTMHSYWVLAYDFYKMCKERLGKRKKFLGIFPYIVKE